MKILENTIVNFHSVDSQDWMEKTFLFFKKHYHLLSIDDLLDYYYSGKCLNNSCHITFDDGDISFYNIVFPILQKHNIPCSIYVSPEAAAKRKNFWFQEIAAYDQKKLKDLIKAKKYISCNIDQVPVLPLFKMLTVKQMWDIILEYQNTCGIEPNACMNMTIEQLKKVNASGLVEIGAHTMNHPILKNESAESAEYEIKKSVEELSEVLGRKIRNFAYPNGDPGLDFGEREKKYLQDVGVKIAFSTRNDRFNKNNDLFSVPRNAINYGGRPFIFLKMLMGKNWIRLKQLKNKKDQVFFRNSMISANCK